MTDLEDLWDDLPVGKAPTHDILRAGRKATSATGPTASTSGAGSWSEPLLTAGLATGIVAAFLAGTLVDDDDGGDDIAGAGPDAGPSNVAFQADLETAESCDELLDTYVDRGLARVTAWGWDEPYNPYWGTRDVLLNGTVVDELSRDLGRDGALLAEGYFAQHRPTHGRQPTRTTWPRPPASRTATPAPTSRRSGSTSRTWSRPTATCCSGCATTSWSSTT